MNRMELFPEACVEVAADRRTPHLTCHQSGSYGRRVEPAKRYYRRKPAATASW